jgi:hypothetical protein
VVHSLVSNLKVDMEGTQFLNSHSTLLSVSYFRRQGILGEHPTSFGYVPRPRHDITVAHSRWQSPFIK